MACLVTFVAFVVGTGLLALIETTIAVHRLRAEMKRCGRFISWTELCATTDDGVVIVNHSCIHWAGRIWWYPFPDGRDPDPPYPRRLSWSINELCILTDCPFLIRSERQLRKYLPGKRIEHAPNVEV